MEAILYAVLCFVLYFAPSIVGEARQHHQRHAITTVNLFLGWTGLGWVVSLAWAMTAVRKPQS